MMWWIHIALVLVLCIIFFQDWKDRAVYWWLFPILLVLAVVKWTASAVHVSDLLTSFLFLFMVLLLLSAYVSLRQKRLVNIFKSDFGWGDVLFLIAVIPLFDHGSYILFFVTGMLFSLGIHLLIFRTNKTTIPLAGYLALYVSLIECLKIIGFDDYLMSINVS